MIDQPEIFWGVIISMYLGNLVLLILNLPLIPYIAKVLTVPRTYLIPFVLFFTLMGVYIGQSTRIYDRESGKIIYGRVPAGSVVVSGNLPAKDGSYSLYCAVIVKRVDEKTRAKVEINDLLRNI